MTLPGDRVPASALILGLSNVAAIAAGPAHSLAIKSNGTVVAWGANDTGQTNVPPGLNNVVAIAAGGGAQRLCPIPNYQVGFSLALKNDGTVIGWGATSVPVGLNNIVAIAAGYKHALALKNDGTVVAWGTNSVGQMNVPPGLSNVIAIAAGSLHSLALKNDGTVVAWGHGFWGSTNVPNGLSNVVAIAGGYYHNLAITASWPLIASVGLSGPNAVVKFPSLPGRNYIVEFSPALSSDSWTNLPGGFVAGNGQDAEVTDTNAAVSLVSTFYRVRQLP